MFLLGVGSDSVIVYIGCFKDNENGSRVMKEFQQNFPDSMTIQKCIDLWISVTIMDFALLECSIGKL